MEAEKLATLREVLGDDTDPNLLAEVLESSNGQIERAIDAYFQKSNIQGAFSGLPAVSKRKRADMEDAWPKVIGFFESPAFAISQISGLSINDRVELKISKSMPASGKRRTKNKENVDRTIRFVVPHISSISIGKLPSHISEVLHPLMSAGFIEVSAVIAEASPQMRILESMRLAVQVSLCASALSEPTEKASDELAKLKVSSDEYFVQREAFSRLFSLLDLVRTQSALIQRDVLINDGLPIEAGQLEHIQRLLQLENTEDQELAETDPAETFTAELYPYQKQALTWMLERETHAEVSSKNRELHHLWEELQVSDGSRIYFNPCSGQVSAKFPTAGQMCRGGILADEMGLGKTVMMTALIHTHRSRAQLPAKKAKSASARGGTW